MTPYRMFECRPYAPETPIRWFDWLVVLALAGISGVVFLSVPANYDFYYSDAPRHALNGAFVLDFVKAMPLKDPVQWAYDYYAQYPALTILFYPPLYPAVLALFYAIFGVSQATALILNAVFYWLLLVGLYRLARRFMRPGSAFAAALLVAAAPEVAFWGRQIMTDVPAMALMVWSALGVAAYLDAPRPRTLFWAALLAVAAIWIKITSVFLLPAFAVALMLVEGPQALRRLHCWIIAGLVVVALLPIAWLTWHFGETNLQSVQGVADGATARLSVANWLWYPRQLPGQLGWLMTMVAVAGLALTIGQCVRSRRMPAGVVWLLAWLVTGYLFFSVIDLKDARFSLPILPPLILMGVAGLDHLCTDAWLRRGALSVLIAATVATSWFLRPLLYVDGYASLVRAIAATAPAGSNVVFSGYRDGAFIYAMRAIGHRPDLNIVRADKLLLRVAIRRSTGISEKDLTSRQIAQELTRIKTSYVVAQTDFWMDLLEMRRFQSVLTSNQFEPVATYSMRANYPAPDQQITVYRNRARLPAKRPTLSIELPAIGQKVSGGG